MRGLATSFFTGVCMLIGAAAAVHAQTPLTTSFTYQGELRRDGAVVSGTFDLQFRLYDSASGGTQLGQTACLDNVQVNEGRFSVPLDFGGQFAGDQRFLEILVREDQGSGCEDESGYETLGSRGELTATPNASYAVSAGVAASANLATFASSASNAMSLNGQPAAFYSDAANLSGTISDGLLSSNVALLNSNQIFTGQVTFNNASNIFAGAFSGDGAGLTSLSGGAIQAGSLARTSLSADLAGSIGNKVTLRTLTPLAAVGGASRSVAINGNVAYSITVDGIRVWNIADPSSPEPLGFGETGTQLSVLANSGTTVYAYGVPNSLYIFDASNPANPVLVSTTPMQGVSGYDEGGMAVVGSYVYLGTWVADALQIIDVSNPAAPVVQPSIPMAFGPTTISFVNGHLAVGEWQTNVLKVFDLSNPAAPTQVGSLNAGFHFMVCTSIGNRYYAAPEGTPQIYSIDMSNPTVPRIESSIATGAPIGGMAATGDLLYVTTGAYAQPGKIEIYDISSGRFVLAGKSADPISPFAPVAYKDGVLIAADNSLRTYATGAGENVIRYDSGVYVDGAASFQGAVNASSFSGSFVGSGASLTGIQASNLAGTLNASSLAGVDGSGLVNLNGAQLAPGSVVRAAIDPEVLTTVSPFTNSVGANVLTPAGATPIGTPIAEPPSLPSGVIYTKFAGGSAHYLALRSDGQVVAVGSNVRGQCNVPTLPSGMTYTDIAATETVSYVLRSDGQLFGFGQETYNRGKLNTPTLASGLTFKSIFLSQIHSIAQLSDDTWIRWGAMESNLPALPPGGTFLKLASNGNTNIAVLSDGSLALWNVMSSEVYNNIPTGVFKDAAVGDLFAAALSTGNQLVVWGTTSGLGTVPATPPTGQYTEIGAEGGRLYALTSDGQVYVWGTPAVTPPTAPANAIFTRLNIVGSARMAHYSTQTPGPTTLATSVGVKIGDSASPAAAGGLSVSGPSTFASSITAGSFIGNGSQLTDLSASNIVGTISDANLPSTVVRTQGSYVMSGTLTSANSYRVQAGSRNLTLDVQGPIPTIQARDYSVGTTLGAININPLGGNVLIGATNGSPNGVPVSTLEVRGPFGDATTAGVFNVTEPTGPIALSMGLAGDYPNVYGWLQTRFANNLGVNGDLRLNPQGGKVIVGGDTASTQLAIGTSSPAAPLDVRVNTLTNTTNAPSILFGAKDFPSGELGQSMINGQTTFTSAVSISNTTVPGEGGIDDATIDFRIGGRTLAHRKAWIDRYGVFHVKVLRIHGGADLVETFDSQSTQTEPGTLMVIDPDHPGELMPSSGAYDTKVAGIVSGAGGVDPGIRMSQPDASMAGRLDVAMTGRVYVKCTTANGAIRPGDLLTTSDIPGHAMKATDRERSPGATVGKAMSKLDEGTGLVLVLVNLQ